jgi:pimeloyl-ACP methyl ester carboxylesterase
MTHVLYFHGFGSGPKTAKGTAVGKRLADVTTSYAIPDLEAGDFFSLTMDRICERAAAAVAALPDDGAPVLVIGSSLGGYTAALLAAQGRIPRADALLLIAPAFGFGERWAERLGTAGVAEWRRTGQRMFFHYASEREQPLGVGFLDSAERLPGFPVAPEIPVVIIHGRRDDTVDWQQSRRYADQDANIEFHLVDGDHRLTDPRHEDLIAWCARDLITRIG